MPLSRRELLLGAAVPPPPRQYRQRSYLGWVTDLDSRPDPNAPWPSMRLDPPLVEDYRRTYRLMRRLGFNNIVIWGLYVARDWPVDIPSAVTPERGRLVTQLIDSAHNEGLRVLSGLGLFSWGFEELIRAYPALGRTNPKAMCASNPDAWKWMERITDFVFTRFPIDGVSLQSADLGRCNCERCMRYSDAEYHARLNIREADYIRARWKEKIVAVSGWGMKFDEPASLPYVREMAEKLDYLIDVDDSTRKHDPAYRRRVIGSLPCDFGTLGGPQVEPPQHWARDRWFLPTPRAQGEHLERLAAEGGRACEYFFHILENPGDELSFWLAGKVLNETGIPWRYHLRSTVEELYQVTRASTVDALIELFLSAETAYLRYLPNLSSGTISLEPLESDRPGPPVYLTERLTLEQRRTYLAGLQQVRAGFERIAPDVRDKVRLPKILRCLEQVARSDT